MYALLNESSGHFNKWALPTFLIVKLLSKAQFADVNIIMSARRLYNSTWILCMGNERVYII